MTRITDLLCRLGLHRWQPFSVQFYGLRVAKRWRCARAPRCLAEKQTLEDRR